MLSPYADMLNKFFKIKGRTDRRTYWAGILTWLIILLVLIWFGKKLEVLAILPKIFTGVMIVPTLTGGIRRLHDIGKSGYWILLALIPAVGWACLFIYFCLPGISEEELARLKWKQEQRRRERGS